mmetsp:Transcript_46731/g.91240  ORF Transcript_46731/g.91240 Transcript_46731/m.91240 type:complete len:259 (+) Transcript_46731:5090-5866(+)
MSGAGHGHDKVLRSDAARGEFVLDPLQDELDVVRHVEEVPDGELSLLEGGDELCLALDAPVVAGDGGAHDRHHVRGRPGLPFHALRRRRVGTGGGGPLRVRFDESVEPRRVDVVVDEILHLHEVGDVVHVGRDVPPDTDLPQRQRHALTRVLPVRPGGEEVSELRIGKFVHHPGGIHGEVPPHVRRGAEVEFLYSPGGGFKTRLGVLGGDPHGDAVSLRCLALVGGKIDGCGRWCFVASVLVLESAPAVELPNFWNVV